jgi:glyoxylase-like metal-dependent hydrolase (beta-lactamase superfamily II)
MKTTSHGDHLTKITKGGFVNAFLVREDDGLTLVDTMLPKSEKGILEAAQALGAPIVRIALTHAHQDHVGSVDALKAALPDVEVLITPRDARFLTGDKALTPEEAVNGKPRGAFVKIETQPTRLINPGDRVGSLEVVPSPGHTPGHVAFLDTRDRTLYCGDAYSTLGGVATTAKVNPRFPLPALATWHGPTALESARALRALDPARLAPGHGKVVSSPAAAMEAAIARGA